MEQRQTNNQSFWNKLVTHEKKFLILFAASLVVFALLTGIFAIIDGAVTDFEGAKLPKADDSALGALKVFFYNSGKSPIITIFQIVIRVAAIVGIGIFLSKSTGSYQIGFSPLFPTHPAWSISLTVAMVLLVPSAVYSLFSEDYIWSILLFVAMAVSDAMFIAYCTMLLRKQGCSKKQRILLPLAASYAYYIVVILLSILPSFSGFSGLEILQLIAPMGLYFGYVLIAPVLMVFVYQMTNSIVAMITPPLTYVIACGLYHGAVNTFKELAYPVIFCILGLVALVALAVTMAVLTFVRLKKNIPLPTDLLCEFYPEGAPEVTFPEGYEEAIKVKKEKKEKEKIKKQDEFAFLTEDTEKTDAPEETTEETTEDVNA